MNFAVLELFGLGGGGNLCENAFGITLSLGNAVKLSLLFIVWTSCCKLILLLNMKFYNVDCTKNFLMEQFRAAANCSGIPRD